jgi:hypothetical protein
MCLHVFAVLVCGALQLLAMQDKHWDDLQLPCSAPEAADAGIVSATGSPADPVSR